MRILDFALNTSRASAVNPGAINTSENCLITDSAVFLSISLLKLIIPPNAEVGSVAKAA